MINFSNESPIIACATGNTVNCAISVLRLSGFERFEDISQCFSKSGPIEPRKVYLTNLIDEEKNLLDQVLMSFFPAPSSYTGENYLELSVHGNLLNVQKIISFFVTNLGFKHGSPGEFTYRALKNKKMNLSQVEGLELVLNASNNLVFSQGMELLQGSLYSDFLNLKIVL